LANFDLFLCLQEGLCADAASFDLPASLLTGCIGEANLCVDLAISHRSLDNAADTSLDPDNFAVLKGLIYI
jgi:regulator of telomere elongation helicase 1